MAEYRAKLQEKVLYVTVNDKCYRITSHGSEEGAQLSSASRKKQTGAYFSMLPMLLERGYQAVVICSEDTDVFIMCLAFHGKIGAPLFQKCGTKTRTRVVDIRKVAATVGIDVCRALVGMHAYTGCDTTSAFAGKGRASALKLLTNNRGNQIHILRIGSGMGPLPRN